jgi:hypothetical protein
MADVSKEICDMNLDIASLASASTRRRAALLLLSVLYGGNGAYAQAVHNIVVSPCNNVDSTFATQKGQAVSAADPDPNITATLSDNTFWVFQQEAGCTLTATPNQFTCAGMTVTAPDPNTALPPLPAQKVAITGAGANVLATGSFKLTLTQNNTAPCDGHFTLRTTATGGGWGDPHMTTVEGVHYDFQSAGEFTALRQPGFMIQTRQRPVSTATAGGTNEYTGLATCVSLYSAVAARIGANRVTLQPNISGQPDPSGLQLRVNGKLVTLGERGIDLRVGGSNESTAKLEGRIVRAAGGAYEFDDAFGTQLVATPTYWDSQQTWYLNLNVYQTIGNEGIWGGIAEGSWLPALSDGTSLGGKPEALDQRYQDLYVKFADSWRVTDATSLFDYASGSNTASFTVADWPRFNARSCAIQGQPVAQPADPQVAAQACSAITDAAQRADCIFDVAVTGNTGFAQTYATMQGFRPHGPGWQPVLTAGGGGTTTGNGLPWWFWLLVLILALILIVVIARKKKTA